MGGSNEIGMRIKELREKHGMTQTELAEKLFTSRETVNMWERGARDIKTGTMIALAEELHTTCDYILRGIESHNVHVSEELGLSNAATNHLRYLCEATSAGEWCEEEQLKAINAILGSPYIRILEDIYKYLITDFHTPYILKNRSSKDPITAFERINVIAFSTNSNVASDTDTPDYNFIGIDSGVLENAYLSTITSTLKRMKYGEEIHAEESNP